MSFNFLLIGESPKKSSPLLTWANALQRLNSSVEFIPDLGSISTRQLIKKIQHADAVVFQGYKDISHYEIKQLSLVPILNKPLIRKWSGSDVLYCYQHEQTYKGSKLLDRVVAQNISSETSTLVTELEKINFKCTLINPILSQPMSAPTINTDLPKSVLVYLPDGREDFYGYQHIKQLIPQFKHLHFYIIANSKNLFSDHPNVTSLGWLDNLDDLWHKTGCLLRLTEHDGISRMVCEALIRGKFVIFSQSLEGCWQATDIKTAKHYLTEFSQSRTINTQGIRTAKKLLTSHNDQALLENLLAAKNAVSFYKRISSFFIFLFLSIQTRIKP